MAESLGLAEFVYQLKRELMQPVPGDVDPVPLLCVDEVDLEIKVGVTRQGKAGVNIQVLSLGAEAQRDDVHTVRVKLTSLLTHDEQVAALRKNGQWDPVERAALRHMVKGVPGDDLARQF